MDNLKLGYGGTKEEMARLLADASELAGKEFEMGNFADIIEAIHVIQENMGITGTTAEEASGTINGSILAWKSALDNLLTGIGRNENIDQLVDNLVDSTEDVIANLVPAIRRASEGFMQVIRVAVVRIGPQVMDAFRDIWNNKLPGILTSAANSIIGLINDIFGTNIPKIDTVELPTWGEISAKVILWANDIRNRIRTIAKWSIGIFTAPTETATEMQTTFTAWWEETAKPNILKWSAWALNLFGMPEADENTITAHVKAWWDGVVTWVQNACVWTLQMFGFAPDAAENAVLKVKQWFAGVIKLLGNALTLFFNWASGMDAAALQAEVETIYEDAKALIGQTLEFVWSLVPGPIQEKLQPLVDGLSEWWTKNEQTILSLLKGINNLYNFLIGTAAGMFSDALSDNDLWASVGSFLSSFIDAAKSIAEALAPVAEATFSAVIGAIKGVLVLMEPILDAIKGALNIIKIPLKGIAAVIDLIADALDWMTKDRISPEELEYYEGLSEENEENRRQRTDHYTYRPIIDEGATLSRLSMLGSYWTDFGKWTEKYAGALPSFSEDVLSAMEEFWDDYREAKSSKDPFETENYIHDLWEALMGSPEAAGMDDDARQRWANEMLLTYLQGLEYLSPDWENLPEEFFSSGIPAAVFGGGGGGKPKSSTDDVVTELETVKTELQGLRNDLLTAVQSLMNRPISIDGQIITQIISQGITRKARTSFG